jgi:hypothetical protein
MVARTLPNSRFTIAFLRGGEVLDVRPAPTGERAVKVALLMLAGMDGLQGGDQLIVREDWDGRTRQRGAFDFPDRRQLIRREGYEKAPFEHVPKLANQTRR